MCDSFIVRNFRVFQELKIPTLNQVNLFVGKNSVGKTALLEALYLYLHTNKEEAIYQLLAKREEHLSDKADLASVVKHLFHKHQLSKPSEEGIVLASLSNTNKIVASKKLEIQTIFDKNDDDVHLNIKINRVAKNHRLTRDFRDFYRQSKMFFGNSKNLDTQEYELRFVYSAGISNNSVAKLWDEIAFSSKQDEVIKALQIIEPYLSDVAFIEATNSRERVAIARINGEKVPFKSMGDGINRILHIVLSMVNAQNGCLLIDEFENGLHYSVQAKLWQVIFELSKMLNVQVFATTHSNDCIQAFGSQWESVQDFATLNRIDFYDNQHTAMPYQFNDLGDALLTNTEVR